MSTANDLVPSHTWQVIPSDYCPENGTFSAGSSQVCTNLFEYMLIHNLGGYLPGQYLKTGAQGTLDALRARKKTSQEGIYSIRYRLSKQYTVSIQFTTVIHILHYLTG